MGLRWILLLIRAVYEDEGGVGIRRGQVGDLLLLIPLNRLWASSRRGLPIG
jgi:hypothetical protein